MTAAIRSRLANWQSRAGRQLLLSAAAAAITLAILPATASAAELKGAFRGNAFGTEANAKAGDIAVTLGRSAYLPCPCKGTAGKTITNEITTLKAKNVASAATVRSTILTNRNTTTASIVVTSTIENLNLLNGLITATTVKAVANANATTTSLSGSTTGTTFLGLKVAGNSISADVAPNTVVNLAGIGKLTLKQVVSRKSSTLVETTVDMVVIDVALSNSFDLDVGARIVIGHALSGYSRNDVNLAVNGQAYITDANTSIGSDLQNRIGRAALVSFGCEGTRGKTLTNSIAGLGVGSIVSLGSGDTTGAGGPDATGAFARTTAKVQSVKLLNGLITASIITSVADERVVNGVLKRSTAGTGFVGLKVLGVSLPVDVPKNTKITLPGLGYVIINEQIVPTSSSGYTQVNGVHIKITSIPLLNVLKLPVNSEIVIAHAHAYVK